MARLELLDRTVDIGIERIGQAGVADRSPEAIKR
jgi:hypothetical protein